MDVATRLHELATLNAIGSILNRESEFERALGPALERLVALLELQTGWVFLSTLDTGDAHQGEFRLSSFTGLPPALAASEQEALCNGRCECQNLLRRGGLDQGVNMVRCSRLADAEGDTGGLSLHASIPLLARQGPVGILNLAAPGDKRFGRETLEFMTAVGRQLGVAFERSKLQAERTREARHLAALEERQRLAQEMHDSVSQLLFAADLSLRVAQESEDNNQRDRALAQGNALVQDALAELRRIVELLRPADLSSGLKAALTRLAQRTSGTLEVRLEADDVATSPAAAETLYRVAQEALHNSLRHAGARSVQVLLKRTAEGTLLELSDDGQGFDPSQVQAGLGLSSMEGRVRALGGQLELASTPGRGTRVRVRLP